MYVTSEGAVSHNVLYHQQPLSITRHQVRLYANKYFYKLPIVSTAFNLHFGAVRIARTSVRWARAKAPHIEKYNRPQSPLAQMTMANLLMRH